jgi:ribosomal protein S18 acetylase RimI-like enzyme
VSAIGETRDKQLLRRIFARDPVGAIYMLGDLEDAAFAHCRWFVDGERAVILIYHGLAVPVMLPFGDLAGLRAILREVELPPRFYTKLDAAQEPLLAEWRLDSPERLYVMGLETLAPAPEVEGLRCEPASEAEELLPLYLDYPGNYFDPFQVASGVYGTARIDGALAGAAGTHACAPSEGAAALGNVVTAASFRGRGVCRGLMHWLCTELARRGVRHIGLHVGRGNTPAIACYRRIGFSIHSEITQWTATGRRS